MIVTCERCETQFQLDEARVPDSGARVRCSRCKHAFVVHPPAASAEAGIEQAVSAAARVGETPDVTEDLPESVAAGAAESADADTGSDWQFNDDDSPFGDEDAPDPEAGTQPDGHPESDTDFGVVGPDEHLALAGEDDEAASDALPFDIDGDDSPFGVAGEGADDRGAAAEAAAPEAAGTLGTPDDWDIFDDLTDGGRTPASSAPVRMPSVSTASREPTIDAEVKPEPTRSAASRASARLWLGRAGGVAGWAFTALLCAIGFAKGLVPPSAQAPEAVVAAGIRVEGAEARWVDNARLGKLYVVSGQLRHTGSASAPMPALELVMFDAAGRALDPTWPLDSPRQGASLREDRSNALAAMRAGFRRPLQAGEMREFEAVAWPLPREAERFEIRVGAEGR